MRVGAEYGRSRALPTTWRSTAVVAAALLASLATLAVGPAPAGATPSAVGPPPEFRGISVGALHSCAILLDGRLKCWGDNFRGQLGIGSTDDLRGDQPGDMGAALPAVRLGSGRSAIQVEVGYQHTCALLDNGSVKCWGANFDGQLGQGPDAETVVGDETGEMGDALPAVNLGTGRTATAISVGQHFSCARLDNATAKCWGIDDRGQLGQGGNTVPPGLGDALPSIPLGSGRTVASIDAGWSHVCAVLDNGDLKCWGANLHGELANPLGDDIGDGPGEMGDALPAIDLGSGRTAVAVSVGSNPSGSHTCALLDNSQIKCWGYNIKGQLGQGDTRSRGFDPNDLGDGLVAVDLGAGATPVAVTGGGASTCALLADGRLKCWGWNIAGQLGLGDTEDRGDEPGEMGGALPVVALGTGRTVQAVAFGNAHACARLDDGSLRCWGQNFAGELGLEDTEDRGDEPGEMGDALPPVDLGDGVPEPVPPCKGLAVTVDLGQGQVPTAAPDVIRGTTGSDTVNALGGADVICGLGGNDAINGGTGRDRIYGQGGTDTLRGGDDADTLDGGPGSDVVRGDNGDDQTFGQDGNDDLQGDAGNDLLDGGNQNDRLSGGVGRDTCHGRLGTDSQSSCEVRSGIP